MLKKNKINISALKSKWIYSGEAFINVFDRISTCVICKHVLYQYYV